MNVVSLQARMRRTTGNRAPLSERRDFTARLGDVRVRPRKDPHQAQSDGLKYGRRRCWLTGEQFFVTAAAFASVEAAGPTPHSTAPFVGIGQIDHATGWRNPI